MTDVLLQIGEFSRLTELPIRTIRFYGQNGLLPPSKIDQANGYRLYDIAQVRRAQQLTALKATGLSLEEIRLVLDDELTNDQFRDLLEAKVVELQGEIERTSEQLERARSHLDVLRIRMETPMPEVTVKTTDRKTIAYLRDQIGGIDEIGPMFPRLFELVDPAEGLDVGGNIYHHFSEDGTSIDIEAALPVPDDYVPLAPAKTRVIEPALVASLTHHGAFNRLAEAHTQLFTWIEENGYVVAGPSYEWNLVCTPPVTQDNESYVTEIHIEIAKA